MGDAQGLEEGSITPFLSTSLSGVCRLQLVYVVEGVARADG